MTKVENEIIDEMCIAMENLGAQSDLLGTACSFRRTLSDKETLIMLKDWNRQFLGDDNKSPASVNRQDYNLCVIP